MGHPTLKLYVIGLILKTMLQKFCRKYNRNITLFAAAVMYI